MRPWPVGSRTFSWLRPALLLGLLLSAAGPLTYADEPWLTEPSGAAEALDEGAVGDEVGPEMNPVAVYERDPRGAGGERGTNFLLITAETFANSTPLNQFIAAKQAQGFTVTVYTATSGTARATIKAYIQSLWGTTNAPAYIMIVGGARFNYPLAEPTYVPTCPVSDPRYVLTDIPYACMDGESDWTPNVAIGRVSVATVAELQAVVDKILYVEAGAFADPNYTRRAVFIAASDPDAQAEAHENYVITTYMDPAGIQSQKLYAETYGATTQDVVNAFDAGCFLGVYFGHAAGTQAWGSPPFVFSDIESLTNANMYPFVISVSCGATDFFLTEPTNHPGMIEKWMLVANKGAAAGWGPANSLEPYTWDSWDEMFRFLFQAIYTEKIRELGPASNAAAAHFTALHGVNDPISKDYTLSWLYLGDPSMRLPEPPKPNYLLVVPASWAGAGAVNTFIGNKTYQGFRVLTYVVPSGTSNTAIRTYIRSLWGTSNAPAYVMIMADTNGNTSTSTTIPHFTGGGSKAAATDWPYVCFGSGDDWYPEIPIGRFPASDLTQLQAMVDKTNFVESGRFSNPNYVKRVAFLANPDTYNTAEPLDDWITSNYLTPSGYEAIKIYAAQGGDTQDVINAVNTGVLFCTYMGHSAQGGWWDPAVDQSTVQGLTNRGLYPLVFGWSCNTAHFDLSSECFGETWVRQVDKGGVAYISASNYIYWGSVEAWAPSAVLERSFFTSFFVDDIWRVGAAWVNALYRFLDEYGQPATPGGPPTQHADEVRNFFEEFVILGDPTLLLPQPSAFRMEASPTGEAVCTPGDTSVTFALNIKKTGTFNEVVTLSVLGLPPGATYNFSTPSGTPPFNSTLLLANLASTPAGTYNVTIHGASTSKTDNVVVTLNVSTAIPGVPSPTAPVNGAVGVARMPTLAWNAATQGVDYTIEVSRNSAFTQIVYAGTVSTTSAAVGVNLDTSTTYYWHVRATNDCGDGQFSPVYSFTTLSQRDYYTQLFSGAFDLTNKTLVFIPNGSANTYGLCVQSATAFPTNPAGGTAITLADDGSRQITFSTAVKLYGVNYTGLYINANGNLSFSSADGGTSGTYAAHFAQPRISALYDDLNPAAGGTVSWRQLTDRIAITFQNVPRWSSGGSNSFQYELLFNGEIHLTYLSLTDTGGVSGLSAGGGVPGDFQESDLSAYANCGAPGACCTGENCTVVIEPNCASQGGVFKGVGTGCDPNPCLSYQSSCLIISEVVQGTESGDCPRWIELTNTGTADFTFSEGGIIVQSGDSSDVNVDINLTGVTILAGHSYVINSNASGACTGAFQAIYGHAANMNTQFVFGLGNERFIITDRADGSHLVDIYGQFGVNGSGQVWEFTDGYAYRLPMWNSGAGGVFRAEEWFLGGVGSLSGMDPTGLLLTLTTPGSHVYNEPCTGLRGDLDHDGDVDTGDLTMLLACLYGPDVAAPQVCEAADLDFDGDVDLDDFSILQAAVTASGG